MEVGQLAWVNWLLCAFVGLDHLLLTSASLFLRVRRHAILKAQS
jgi:hypothetical protein